MSSQAYLVFHSYIMVLQFIQKRVSCRAFFLGVRIQYPAWIPWRELIASEVVRHFNQQKLNVIDGPSDVVTKKREAPAAVQRQVSQQ